jgi:putative transposase
MSEPVLHSTSSNCLPISSSRSCSAGCDTSSAYGTWQRCFCCVDSNSLMKRCGTGKNGLPRCWLSTSARKRKGKVGRRWYVDETYIRVKGKWCYLYRAIDREGNLVDSMLSATRDMDAAQRFFRCARSMSNVPPTQVTTDGHDSYPRAIRETLGPKVKHRCSAYMNRRIERNHREVKQRYYPMLGFGSLHSTQRFWRAFEEVRQYFRPRRKQNDVISLSKARQQFLFRASHLEAAFVAA